MQKLLILYLLGKLSQKLMVDGLLILLEELDLFLLNLQPLSEKIYKLMFMVLLLSFLQVILLQPL
jgi:hypothetical protein